MTPRGRMCVAVLLALAAGLTGCPRPHDDAAGDSRETLGAVEELAAQEDAGVEPELELWAERPPENQAEDTNGQEPPAEAAEDPHAEVATEAEANLPEAAASLELGPPPACGDVDCGLGMGPGGLVVCAWCPEPKVCRGGQCVPTACVTDADCRADSATLPGGLTRVCQAGSCAYRFADGSEVLLNLQRLHQGLVLETRQVRVSKSGVALSPYFPGAQGITPPEMTCCHNLGGPDSNHDGLCDADPDIWTQPSWSDLGFVVEGPHFAVYDVQLQDAIPASSAKVRFEAFSDLDCNGYQETFHLTRTHDDLYTSSGPLEDALPPASIGFEWAAAGDDPGEAVVRTGEIELTPAQQSGFMPPVGLKSFNPNYEEMADFLQMIVDGAIAYYEAQPADACRFPEMQGITPMELTCCNALGGPDADKDWFCDPDAEIWSQPTWAHLDFMIPRSHAFVYSFDAAGTGASARFTASAFGDIDCDGTQSTFQRLGFGLGTGATGCDAEAQDGYYIERETE
jgi:hypothetical protein